MASSGLDRNKVAELQRKYSGLDDDLNYEPEHTIRRKYDAYKAADKAAGAAGKSYKEKATELKAKKPYDTSQKRADVGGKTFYKSGHETLAPLAGTASTTAPIVGAVQQMRFVPRLNTNLRPTIHSHADRRDSFNEKYKDVLTAKGPKHYQNHVQAAKQAQSSADKYAEYKRKHEGFSK